MRSRRVPAGRLRSRRCNSREMHNGAMNCPSAFGLALLALLSLPPSGAGAQDIYKCMQGGQVAYTDHPCAPGKGELLHQADATETIDYYLRLGQDGQAEAWAKAHHQEPLYQQRVALRDAAAKAQAERAQRQAQAAQQQAEQARAQAQQLASQQALATQAAESARLQAENAALRQQNDAYQAELDQPAYVMPPYGWGRPLRPYPSPRPPRPGQHEPDRPGTQRPPPVRDRPAVRECSTLTGAHVQC